MEYFKEKIPEIEREIRQFLPEDNSNVSRPFYELFNRGGKRIRPIITHLTSEALGEADVSKLSIIPELIHTGTLLVDDLEDKSETRRNGPAIHLIEGEAITVNGGNFLYFYPLSIIKESNLTSEQKVKLYELVSTKLTELHRGQAMDIGWAQDVKQISIEEYLQMCAYKTGSLMSVAMQIAGIVNNSGRLQELDSIATKMGIAFQIKDDILNLHSTDEWTKETGEDITEGKISYLVVKADNEELRSILKEHTKDKDKIKRAIEIIEQSGAFEDAENYANQLLDEAKELVMDVFPESKARITFLEIIEYMLNRKL